MATLAETPRPSDTVAPRHWSDLRLSDADLAHIPGEAGWPVVGNTFTMLADPHAFAARMIKTHGKVYKNRAFGGWQIALIGAEANELLLFNKDKIFSSEQGWGPVLDQLFPRGLMLIDFEHHRIDRRALSIAFKPEPMRHYSDALNRGIAREVAGWAGPKEFYPAIKKLTLDLAAGARLEWLPLEALAYPGCRALNQLTATLAPGAELLAWDVTALGLPASDKPFSRGRITQRLELPGRWLEQVHIDASDHRLLASPLGLAGQRCLGSLLFVVGEPLDRARREQLLEAVRSALQNMPPGVQAAATCPNPHLLLVRALAPVVEPLMNTLQGCWAALRQEAWKLKPVPPRIWGV